MPDILIIAGPNGAGKTTFARQYLSREGRLSIFINADEIAAELSPSDPEAAAIEAGRSMLQQIEEHVRARDSFAFETTLSGRGYARLIPRWRRDGFRVQLIYLSLPNADLAVHRVLLRVRQGGHPIPEHVIRRRFEQGCRNFEKIYRHLVDAWAHYDNSGDGPVLLARGEFT